MQLFMDLIDEGPGGAPDNAPELSVSEISLNRPSKRGPPTPARSFTAR